MNKILSYLPVAARILLGLAFFVFGLNGFLDFIPKPTNMAPGSMAFFMALVNTGYMLKLIAGTEVLVGALLLVNRFVPLALAFLAPLVVNIVFFHVFLDRAGMAPAAIVAILELYLAWSYRSAFLPMLKAKNKPAA